MTRSLDDASRSSLSSHRGVIIAVLAFIGALILIGLLLVLGLGDSGKSNENPGIANQEPTPTEQTGMTATEASPTDTDTATPSASPTASDLTPPTSSPSPTIPTSPPDPTATEIEPTLPPPTNTPPEPTATPEPPSPTPEPAMGDFGTLPAGLLPSGGVSTVLDLDYELGMSLESLPTSASAFLIEWPIYSREEVTSAAERLGLIAPVEELGVGIYSVSADRGSLFVSPNEIIFTATGLGIGGDLPGDSTAVDLGRTWLELSGFVGPDMDAGAVAGRDPDLQRVVVIFRPVEPQPNLAPNPSATVNIGPGGEVIEARIHWPATLPSSTYGLNDPLVIWQTLLSGQGFLEADVTGVAASGTLTGIATITDFSIAYTLAGQPSEQQFLVPVITFHGIALIEQTGDEIPISVTVPAVYHQIGSSG